MGQRIEPGANNGSAHLGLVTIRYQIFVVAAFLSLRPLREINFQFPIKKSTHKIFRFCNNDNLKTMTTKTIELELFNS